MGSGAARAAGADTGRGRPRGLRAILESEPDLIVVGEADDGAAVFAQARRTRPDIVLMDVRMPRVDGIAATRQLGQFAGGGPAVIVVTTFENDDYVYDALQAGARGFLLKRSSAEDYVNAIRTVYEGESLLFPAAVRRLAIRHGGPGGRGLAEATSPTARPRSCGSSHRADPTRRSRPSCSSAWRPSRPTCATCWPSSAPGTAFRP